MSPEEHKHILRTGLATVVGLVVITLLDNLSWWVPVIGLVLVYPLGLGFFRSVETANDIGYHSAPPYDRQPDGTADKLQEGGRSRASPDRLPGPASARCGAPTASARPLVGRATLWDYPRCLRDGSVSARSWRA